MRNGIKWLPVFLSILLLIAGLASAEEAVPMDFQTLQAGDKGEQVTLLQQKLADAGYLEAASGVYDEATEQAVLRLQQNYGLEETGVADIETQEVIFGGCYLVLEEGMSGPKVAALQDQIDELVQNLQSGALQEKVQGIEQKVDDLRNNVNTPSVDINKVVQDLKNLFKSE